MDVRCGVEIRRITRRPDDRHSPVTVETTTGELTFDRLIVACPLDAALEFLDASDEERVLFRAIRSCSLWQAAVKMTGLDALPGALILDENQSYDRRGRPIFVCRHHPDQPWYYVVGYARPGQLASDVEQEVTAQLTALGGRLLAPPDVVFWPHYFPHYGRPELEAGYLPRLERLQGQRATYYVGEILANLSVQSAVEYAQGAADRFFGTQGDTGQ
jgi:protoporphyrinogen oxidase